MPHKHTRRKDGEDKNFNLPPTLQAKPLPTFDQALKQKRKRADAQAQSQANKRKRVNGVTKYREDDTPKEFARLMQFQVKGRHRSGLDDGVISKSKKKQKTQKPATDEANGGANHSTPLTQKEDTIPVPKIMPGERLSDFNARVDQSMPITGPPKKGKKVDGMTERQTKTEKRLKKMYAQWRDDDARYKEKLDELQEQEEENDEELEAQYGEAVKFSNGSNARRKRMVGEAAGDDDDPWEVLKQRREAPKGLHDVVQAPPSMTVIPKEKFKVRGGAKVNVANVPTASGSLKRREELSDARQEVIDRYRAMMKDGRL